MATTTQVRWGKRARWSFCVGAVFAVFGACSGRTIEHPASDSGGKGGGGKGAVGGEGHLPTAGTTNAVPNAGASAVPNGGTGGVDNEHPPHGAGNAGCSLDDECGGCEPAYYVIACSWGELEAQPDPENDGWQTGCLAAQDREGAGGAGGAGSANADAAGAAGALGYPGACRTYKPRGDVVVGCDEGCAETFHEDKAGECVLRNECCVVLRRMGCSP